MMWMMWPFGFGFMGWWVVLAVIFWGGLIALIIWGVRRLGCCGTSYRGHDALDTARERYAKGEISKEQFEQLKKDLS